MTAQIPDLLIHRGRRLNLCAMPLDDYLLRLPKGRRPRFRLTSSACWRGYVASWEISDGQLWLTGLEGCLETTGGELREADLATAFPWRRGPIAARWVSGELRCPEGRLRQYVHAAFASRYERDRIFDIDRGHVRMEILVYNPPAPLCYEIHADGSRTLLDGREAVPDPFGPDEPVEPWKLWGQKDWDVRPGQEESERSSWFLGGETRFGPAGGEGGSRSS